MTQISPEQDTFLDQITETLCRRRLRFPALLALESAGPLAFIGGQLLWLSQPVLSLFLSTQALRQTAHLLENPDALADLAARLEAREI